MSSRPAIPAELRRKVLTASGHRCSIPTCRQTQVEVHHIIPWEKCRTHEFENLIALCPNCHTRVHSGEIDRKSLHLYKAKLGQLYSSEEGVLDHGTISTGTVLLNRSDARTHILTVAGNIMIQVGDWENDVDSIILKIRGAGSYTTTWHGFSELPFAEGFCFKENHQAIVEIVHYSGDVLFIPISGGYIWKDHDFEGEDA